MPGKYIPTEEEINKLKEMASEGLTLTNMSEYINHTRECVKRILSEYNIELKPSPENRSGRKYDWSTHKLRLLKEMYLSEDVLLSEIASILETSSSTVLKQAKRMGLNKIKVKPELYKDRMTGRKIISSNLTEEEDKYLRDNVTKKSLAKIADDLKKPRWVIQKYCRRHKIEERFKHYKIPIPSNKEDLDMVKNPAYSDAYIARKLEISSGAVRRWRKELFGNRKCMVDTFLNKTNAEIDLEEILSELNLSFLYEHKIDKYKVDFYLGFNYIIEVYGHYWHDKKEKTMKRDIIKNNYLKDNGYLVDIIWEDEIQNKKDEVKNRILASLNKQIKQYFRSRNLVNSKMEVSDENQANGSELSD